MRRHRHRGGRIAVAAALSLAVFGVRAPVATGAQASGSDWPQALGPQRNATSPTSVAAWGADGPVLRWRQPVGEGFAGPAVVGDTLILFHRVGDEEIVEARDTGTGDVR